MKYLVFLLFLAVGCVTVQETNDSPFMGLEEIKEEMNSPSIEESSILTVEERERESQLIPLDEFWDEEPALDNNSTSSVLNLKQSVDLRHRDTSVKKQWNGTCTTYAGVALMENLLNGKIDLSERDSWETYKKYSCSVFIKSLSKNKICEEKYWPQNNLSPYSKCEKNRHTGLIKSTYLGRDSMKAVRALNEGKPVYLCLTTPKDMLKGRATIRWDSAKSNGGHAVAAIGYTLDPDIKGGGFWKIKNSWGLIGDKGYQYVPFGYCDRSDLYCRMWSIDSVVSKTPSVEPITPDPVTPEPAKPVYKKVCKRTWYSFWTRKKCWWKKVN